VAVALPPDRPHPEEAAAALIHPIPTHPRLDAGGWLAWSLAGLRLFDGPDLPQLRDARDEARHLLVSLAMLRNRGTISRSARALGTSRKVLRDHLREAALYPWPGQPTAAPGSPRRSPPLEFIR